MDAKELFTGMNDELLLETAQAALDVATERGLAVRVGVGMVAVEVLQQEQLADADDSENAETKEQLTNQLSNAVVGYSTVAETLNQGRRNRKNKIDVASEEDIAEELKAWLTPDKVEYVAKAMEADPNLRFTLVATPNVVAKVDEIANLATEFGKDQPYSTYIYNPLYERYTPEQLSGTSPDDGNSVKFSLIPSAVDPSLQGTASQQRARLAELQAANPDLDLSVPSVLEAVTHWQTLRAQGNNQLAGSNTFDETIIRHFDLPERRVDDWSSVPGSYVGDDGGPYLNASFAGFVLVGGRVAVG